MAFERRREGIVLLAEREWREHPASLKWLLGINAVLLILYLIQIGAATIAAPATVSTTALLMAASPVLVLLVVGIWIQWVGNAAGVGVLFAVDTFVALAAAVIATLPGLVGGFGGVTVTGTTGTAFAGLAFFVPLVAFVGMLAGIWAMMDLYDRLGLPETALAT